MLLNIPNRLLFLQAVGCGFQVGGILKCYKYRCVQPCLAQLIGAAIENMILSLNDMGLGSVWIGNTNIINEEISDILDVNHETVSSIAIGVPNQSPKMRPRKPLDEVLIVRKDNEK